MLIYLGIVFYKGYGRKNTPIWEGHSFGWGARRRTAVYVPYSAYTMAWLGEHRAFIVEEIIKKWRVSWTCYLLAWWYRVAAAFARFDPLRFFCLGLPQSKGLRTTPRTFWSSEGGDTTGSYYHYTWNDSQGHGQLPREATPEYQYSRPPLEWCFV